MSAYKPTNNLLASSLGIEKELQELFGSNVTNARNLERDISTQFGIPSLDLFLGGGLTSSVVEVYGADSVGKTALVGRLMSRSQQLGKCTYLVATEFLDAPYLQNLGVDLGTLRVVRGFGVAVVDTLVQLSRNQNTLIVVDTLTSLRPHEENLTSWNELALELLGNVRNCLPVGSTFVAVSQVRFRQGGKHTTSASKRLSDIFSTRLELMRSRGSEDAFKLQINIRKNPLAPSDVAITLPVTKGFGIAWHIDAVRLGLECGILTRKGPGVIWTKWGDCLGRSEKDAADTLRSGQNLFESVYAGILRSQ